MGKDKLRKFREIDGFENVLQLEEGKPFKGRWSELFFKNDKPITLELACGKGEYTVNMSHAFPERNFIGVDFKGNRLWRGAKTALEQQQDNVAFLRIRIEDILDYFAEDEVNEIWITFPDPQPQLSREKKRLTSPRFMQMYQIILETEGHMHLKTDNVGLYQYTREQIVVNEAKELKATDDLYQSVWLNETLQIKTFYEQKYLAENCPIHYINWQF